jgi:hypothetical protein
MGTTCPAIKELSHEIISNLSKQYKCAYIDAAHAKENEEVILPGRLSAGAVAEYSDRINYHDIALHQSLSPFQFGSYLAMPILSL